VFRSLKSYRSDEGAFATWLARLSRNLLIDHYRRGKQDRATDSIEEQLPMIEERAATSARTPDEDVERWRRALSASKNRLLECAKQPT